MATARNVEATAVGTVAWLSDSVTSIVVPVYQRQYRWDIGGCEQLLSDVRDAADAGEGQTHFIGSILSTGGDDGELILIDGQQRVTTLMLLVAALQHTVADHDPELAARLQRFLVRPDDPGRTKLRPHVAWADLFDAVVLGRGGDAEVESRFEDNYAFFRSQIRLEDAPRIWRGLQRLEHVSITLGAEANAQQIFESLNSTGEPLRDHELIHNYVLMGLTHAEQREIEDEFWVPIEQNTGSSIGAFWRHVMIMVTGREVSVGAEHGVYAAFRQEFPRWDVATLREHATRWRDWSDVYRMLLDPASAPDVALGRQLAYLNTFGRAMYPLVMRAVYDVTVGTGSREVLLQTLEYIQTLLLRRLVVGLSNDRLVARLCRAREAGQDDLERAIARITPSDERVRVSLKYGDLPHPAYVLGRLYGLDSVADLDVEHVFPLAPGDTWTGDGIRPWAEYSEDEQNSHRALAQTLGNVTLVEESIAMTATGEPFPRKRDLYARSGIAETRELGAREAWGTAEISRRTTELTARFTALWTRPTVVLIDDDGLTPILDAVRRRGWPRGWEREFDYTEYRGEHWEVHDVKYLFHRVFSRLWADQRDAVVAFNARRGGPVYPSMAWKGQWHRLDDENFLYLGWDSRYMLTAVQGLLDEAGIAPEVFVKYSYVAAAM
jgi:hypothetical protein